MAPPETHSRFSAKPDLRAVRNKGSDGWFLVEAAGGGAPEVPAVHRGGQDPTSRAAGERERDIGSRGAAAPPYIEMFAHPIGG